MFQICMLATYISRGTENKPWKNQQCILPQNFGYLISEGNKTDT